jgi:hypothetical protein
MRITQQRIILLAWATNYIKYQYIKQSHNSFIFTCHISCEYSQCMCNYRHENTYSFICYYYDTLTQLNSIKHCIQ